MEQVFKNACCRTSVLSPGSFALHQLRSIDPHKLYQCWSRCFKAALQLALLRGPHQMVVWSIGSSDGPNVVAVHHCPYISFVVPPTWDGLTWDIKIWAGGSFENFNHFHLCSVWTWGWCPIWRRWMSSWCVISGYFHYVTHFRLKLFYKLDSRGRNLGKESYQPALEWKKTHGHGQLIGLTRRILQKSLLAGMKQNRVVMNSWCWKLLNITAAATFWGWQSGISLSLNQNVWKQAI